MTAVSRYYEMEPSVVTGYIYGAESSLSARKGCFLK